ncbi:putative MATE family efflux protein [Chitinophaga skermanii]|uniref:Multidrug-efflux transporter n=1 Tax=Chitinophaga skermanii TaxID=331697 RepID=A0A327QKG1_9BACT|nr:MATE family efflux transporter [Chitinophaga skermanii]RAJ02247.1 putative MATE family efflux protein [Chitinophaga skermanii]
MYEAIYAVFLYTRTKPYLCEQSYAIQPVMQVVVNTRQIIKIAAPISLALIVPQINHMTNTAFIGRLGDFELAANGIAGIYYLVMYMIAYGLNNGIQVIIARRAGEKNESGIGQVFSNGISLCLLFSLVAVSITFFIAPWVFRHTLHDPHILEAALSFIYTRIWGLPFLMLLGLANSFYIGSGNTRILAVTSLFQEVTNIFFDYTLIFGAWGFPAMGLNGAAVASIIAEITGCGVAYSMIFLLGYHKRFSLFQYLRPRLETAKHILVVSAPLIVQYLFSIGSWMVFFVFIEHLGTRPLAISNMMRSIFGFFGIFTWALAATSNTMVSNLIGQGKQEEVFKAIRKIALISIGCALCVCTILNIFPYTLLHVYTPDAALIEEALPSIRILTISTVLTSVAAVVFNGVTGTGNTKVNLLIEFTAVVCYLLYCEIVIDQLRKPLHWAWGSEFVYWMVIIVMCLWYLSTGKWKNKKI